MTTKRIQRTVIEGGRNSYSKANRRESSGIERVRVREFLHGAMRDPELLEDSFLPERDHVYKDFRDKLSPAYRWLLKHGRGKSASEIRGLLLRHFDTRTISGQHIVYDHLMPFLSNYDMSWYSSAGTIDPVHGLVPQTNWGKPGKKGIAQRRKKTKIQMRQTKAHEMRIEAAHERKLKESRIKDPQVRKLLGLT